MMFSKTSRVVKVCLVLFLLVGARPGWAMIDVTLPLMYDETVDHEAVAQVAKTVDFSEVFAESKLSSTRSMSLSLPAEGVYWWRVLHKGWMIGHGAFVAIDSKRSPHPKMMLRWRPVEGIASFEVRYLAADGKLVKSVETKGLTMELEGDLAPVIALVPKAKGKALANPEGYLQLSIEGLAQTIAEAPPTPAKEPPPPAEKPTPPLPQPLEKQPAPSAETSDYDEDAYESNSYGEQEESSDAEPSAEQQSSQPAQSPATETKSQPIRYETKFAGKLVQESFTVTRDADYEAAKTPAVGVVVDADVSGHLLSGSLWLDAHGTKTRYGDGGKKRPKETQARAFLMASPGINVLGFWRQIERHSLVLAVDLNAGIFPLSRDDEVVFFYGLGARYRAQVSSSFALAAAFDSFLSHGHFVRLWATYTLSPKTELAFGLFDRPLKLENGSDSSRFKERGLLVGVGFSH